MLNIDRSQNQSYIINSYFKRRKTLLWRVYLTFKQTRIYFVPTFYKVHHFLFGTLKYNLKSLQLLWTCVQGSLIAINNFLHFWLRSYRIFSACMIYPGERQRTSRPFSKRSHRKISRPGWSLFKINFTKKKHDGLEVKI